jgi:hypothetical protein
MAAARDSQLAPRITRYHGTQIVGRARLARSCDIIALALDCHQRRPPYGAKIDDFTPPTEACTTDIAILIYGSYVLEKKLGGEIHEGRIQSQEGKVLRVGPVVAHGLIE